MAPGRIRIQDVVMGEALRFCSVCVHDEQFRRGLSLLLVHVSGKSDFRAIRRPAGVPVCLLRAVCEPASAGAIIVHDENITIHTKHDFRINRQESPREPEQTPREEKTYCS